ncbi:MAG TPA: hypothetical protein VM901_08815 [Bdellovibrionota bacterium]|jgi:hypothetical protein|nr:hypothetical protein [Bdellovibrionota bacterium]
MKPILSLSLALFLVPVMAAANPSWKALETYQYDLKKIPYCKGEGARDFNRNFEGAYQSSEAKTQGGIIVLTANRRSHEKRPIIVEQSITVGDEGIESYTRKTFTHQDIIGRKTYNYIDRRVGEVLQHKTYGNASLSGYCKKVSAEKRKLQVTLFKQVKSIRTQEFITFAVNRAGAASVSFNQLSEVMPTNAVAGAVGVAGMPIKGVLSVVTFGYAKSPKFNASLGSKWTNNDALPVSKLR